MEALTHQAGCDCDGMQLREGMVDLGPDSVRLAAGNAEWLGQHPLPSFPVSQVSFPEIQT